MMRRFGIWLLAVFIVVLVLCGCKESRAEQRDGLAKVAWAEDFLAKIESVNVPEIEYDRYADKICKELVLPQWKPASDIDSALSQMKSLMNDIDANFYMQKDIGFGWVAYYYDVGSGVIAEMAAPDFNFLLDNNYQNKNKTPELIDEVGRLYKEYGLRSGVQLNYQRAYGSYVIEKEKGIAGFMYPVVDVSNLDKFWESEELRRPPNFILALLGNDYKTGTRPYPDPAQWKYLFSERRDGFSYLYFIEILPIPLKIGGMESHSDKFSLHLDFDAKRNPDGSLTDIQLRHVNCGFPPVYAPVKQELFLPFKDKVYEPEAPVFAKPCPEHQRWLYCYGHSFSERYRAVEKSCQKSSVAEPACINQKDN